MINNFQLTLKSYDSVYNDREAIQAEASSSNNGMDRRSIVTVVDSIYILPCHASALALVDSFSHSCGHGRRKPNPPIPKKINIHVKQTGSVLWTCDHMGIFLLESMMLQCDILPRCWAKEAQQRPWSSGLRFDEYNGRYLQWLLEWQVLLVATSTRQDPGSVTGMVKENPRKVCILPILKQIGASAGLLTWCDFSDQRRLHRDKYTFQCKSQHWI